MKVSIIPYHRDYAKSFYELNIEWLNTFFYVEPYDNKVLSNPEYYIISKGGYIFFAMYHNIVVGTVALMPTNETTVFELTKMAVTPKYRGYKIGQDLLKHCIKFSKSIKLSGLMLYSNTKLKNAIYLYRKYGFTELKLEDGNPYQRADIKMILALN